MRKVRARERERERLYDLEGNPLHEPPDLELYVAFPDREGKMGEGRSRVRERLRVQLG